MNSKPTIPSPHGFTVALDLANHKCCTSTHLVHEHSSALLQSQPAEPRLRMVKDNTNRSPNYGELESERWGEERGSLGIECWERVSECEGWGMRGSLYLRIPLSFNLKPGVMGLLK